MTSPSTNKWHPGRKKYLIGDHEWTLQELAPLIGKTVAQLRGWAQRGYLEELALHALSKLPKGKTDVKNVSNS